MTPYHLAIIRMFRVVYLFYGILCIISSASAALICGSLGFHNETNISFYMGNFFYDSPSTFTLCAAFCKKDTRCQAFRYSGDGTNQFCEFFDTSL